MKRSVIVLIATMSLQLLHAQSPSIKLWDYRYGGTSADYLRSMQPTSDGGYILGGFSKSAISGDKTEASWGGYDYWIVKIDAMGIMQWDRNFGGTGDDQLCAVQQTMDGGYILGGSSNSGIDGDKSQPNWDSVNFSHDYWIVKIDSLGNKEWDKDFGGTANDFMVSMQQTADGGYLLGGNSVSGIGGDKSESNWDSLSFNYDYWVVKIDSLGNKQWDKDLGGEEDDDLASVVQTMDGDYLLAGVSSSGISGDKTESSWGGYDYWIVKINSLGVLQWDKDFGGTENDILYAMQYTLDGGYILAGVSFSGISGDKTEPNWDNSNTSGDYWIVKIDSIGGIMWDKVLGGTFGEPRIGTVSQTADEGYLIAGMSYSEISGNKTENNLGVEQSWVVKIDSLGGVQWDKTIFTTTEDENGFALQTKEGCYIIANNTHAGIGGYKSQDSWGFEDFWVLEFCDSTSIPTSMNSAPELYGGLMVHPNPFATAITLTADIQYASHVSIIIRDILGQTIFSTNEINHAGPLTETIDLGSFSKGIYFLETDIDFGIPDKPGERVITKLVKQ